jgi:hypothetical protein
MSKRRISHIEAKWNVQTDFSHGPPTSRFIVAAIRSETQEEKEEDTTSQSRIAQRARKSNQAEIDFVFPLHPQFDSPCQQRVRSVTGMSSILDIPS